MARSLLLFLIINSILAASIETLDQISKIPIIYHKNYTISFYGLEKLHPFDTQKYTHVYQSLKKLGYQDQQFYTPTPITDTDLLAIHTQRYLDSLKHSATIADITCIPLLYWAPQFVLSKKLLIPMKFATGGTLLGIDVALTHGWAINLSGGYHHAKADSGEGFCIYADIPLAANYYLQKHPHHKILIIDLDAHQGNGCSSICRHNKQIDIFDMYNENIYPNDKEAQKGITFSVPLSSYVADKEYLHILTTQLTAAFEYSQPDFIIYNAGTDILKGDRLGRMAITQEGIVQRDEIVFSLAKKNNIPILMVLSGGYTKQSSYAISASVKNILSKTIMQP